MRSNPFLALGMALLAGCGDGGVPESGPRYYLRSVRVANAGFAPSSATPPFDPACALPGPTPLFPASDPPDGPLVLAPSSAPGPDFPVPAWCTGPGWTHTYQPTRVDPAVRPVQITFQGAAGVAGSVTCTVTGAHPATLVVDAGHPASGFTAMSLDPAVDQLACAATGYRVVNVLGADVGAAEYGEIVLVVELPAP